MNFPTTLIALLATGALAAPQWGGSQTGQTGQQGGSGSSHEGGGGGGKGGSTAIGNGNQETKNTNTFVDTDTCSNSGGTVVCCNTVNNNSGAAGLLGLVGLGGLLGGSCIAGSDCSGGTVACCPNSVTQVGLANLNVPILNSQCSQNSLL